MTTPHRIREICIYRCDTGMDRSFVFVTIRAESGLLGIGEASQSRHDAALIETLRALAGELLGADPFDLIEKLAWRYTLDATGRLATIACSAVEIALWDLIGRALDQPVHRLLGGSTRDELASYATVSAGLRTHTPAALVTEVHRAVERGFRAVKIVPFVEALQRQPEPASPDDIAPGLARIAAVRREFDVDALDFMIECAFTLQRRTTVLDVASRCAEFGCYWLEAPLRWDDPVELAAVRDRIPQRLASGEFPFGRRGAQPLIEARCVDVLQPDVKWAGGILEVKKIAAWAEIHGITVAPHNNSGPVATAASAQLALTLPNFEILEVASNDPAWLPDVFGPGLVVGGRVTKQRLSAAPGLGLPVDVPALAAAATVAVTVDGT